MKDDLVKAFVLFTTNVNNYDKRFTADYNVSVVMVVFNTWAEYIVMLCDYVFLPLYLKQLLQPFTSVSVKEIRLQPSDNSSEATEWSRELMRIQYEWLFINLTVTSNNVSDLTDQDVVIYTVGITSLTYKPLITVYKTTVFLSFSVWVWDDLSYVLYSFWEYDFKLHSLLLFHWNLIFILYIFHPSNNAVH